MYTTGIGENTSTEKTTARGITTPNDNATMKRIVILPLRQSPNYIVCEFDRLNDHTPNLTWHMS